MFSTKSVQQSIFFYRIPYNMPMIKNYFGAKEIAVQAIDTVKNIEFDAIYAYM